MKTNNGNDNNGIRSQQPKRNAENDADVNKDLRKTSGATNKGSDGLLGANDIINNPDSSDVRSDNDESKGKKQPVAGQNAQRQGNSGGSNQQQNDDRSQQQNKNKNSAAKAASHAQSAVGNANPNVRTGLSDDINNTGTNVAYTEREA